MDNQHLRELFEVYRPGVDDQDEQFTEFVTTLRDDPALQRQLAERVARDNAIAAQLRSVHPPADLKARLLGERNGIALPASSWRPPHWLSVAAAIVMLGVVGFWLTKTRQDTFPMYRIDMTKFVVADSPLDVPQDSLDALRQAFAVKEWPATYVVPAGLQTLAVAGGSLREWHGQKVALVRFKTKTDGAVWLFVADRHVAVDVPASPDPQVARAGTITTASWTRGEFTYILATDSSTVPIQRYF